MKAQSPNRGFKQESLCLVFCLLFAATANAVEKSELRVLYVGPGPVSPADVPTWPHGVPRDLSTEERERFAELRSERPEAFRRLLAEHFDRFKIIVADDYRIELSDRFDVTIFDAQPPVIETQKQAYGWDRKIRLPDDFSQPAMMIGEVGPFTVGKFGNGFLLDDL